MINNFVQLWERLVNSAAKIGQFDLVEIVKIPKGLEGIIDIGDTGTVLDIYDDENFEVECNRSDGSYKWLMPLPVRYLKLKSKDPYDIPKKTSNGEE